eukprot:7183709-Lingulodinium_polyedra.AAC.1
MLDTLAQQNALKAEQRKTTEDMRNAEERRRRLRTRCKELPAEDLLELLAAARAGRNSLGNF